MILLIKDSRRNTHSVDIYCKREYMTLIVTLKKFIDIRYNVYKYIVTGQTMKKK